MAIWKGLRRWFSDGEAHVVHPKAFAHERDRETSNRYGVGVDESNMTILHATTAVDVAVGVPALLFGLVNSHSAAVTVTVSGFLDESAVARAQVYTVPADSRLDFKGDKCSPTLTVTASVADVIGVEWRKQ